MEGRVGIIYSPGFGAGWSTWGKKEMALDQELAKAIEQGDREEVLKVAKEKYPDAYLGGLIDAVVEWVEPGTVFRIDEYDGNEAIVFDYSDYQVAK